MLGYNIARRTTETQVNNPYTIDLSLIPIHSLGKESTSGLCIAVEHLINTYRTLQTKLLAGRQIDAHTLIHHLFYWDIRRRMDVKRCRLVRDETLLYEEMQNP